MGWKESKQTNTTSDEAVSETSSEHKDLTGKKTSEEGVHVATAVREVQ
jgi:high-affinity iron transporter